MSKKFWRRFNTILLLFAFLAPWRSCGAGMGGVNGFWITTLYGLSIATSDMSPKSGGLDEILIPIIFIGLLCILLYALVNLFGITSQIFSRFRIGLLIGGYLGMLVSLVPTTVSDTSLKEYLWGYWLTWIGLLYSLGIELMEID